MSTRAGWYFYRNPSSTVDRKWSAVKDTTPPRGTRMVIGSLHCIHDGDFVLVHVYYGTKRQAHPVSSGCAEMSTTSPSLFNPRRVLK